MSGYLVNFTVYTMAMLGLIFFAVFVYKKFANGGIYKDNTKFLSIEETMSINPRKSLLVVRAGNEKFLIASDVDRTTMLSKLETTQKIRPQETFNKMMIEEEPSPVISTRKPQQRIIDMDIIQPEHEPVRLETIRQKNPEGRTLKPQMDRREPSKQTEKTVVLDFDKPTNHGFTTMREMAKKINEL